MDVFYLFIFIFLIGLIFSCLSLLIKDRQLENFFSKKFFLKIVYILIALYLITFTILSFSKHYSFNSSGDLSLFDRVIWNASKGRFSFTLFDSSPCSLLGRHFSPIVFFLSLFYLLWEDPRMLLVIQSLVLALPALIIYRLAKEKLKNEFIALSFSAAYLLSPLLQWGNVSDFHQSAFAPLFILLVFYFLQKRKFAKYALFLGLLLLCKEDTTFYAFTFGFYAFFFQKERKVGLLTMLISILWGITVFRIVIPYFRGDLGQNYWLAEKFVQRYDWLGDRPLDFVKTIFFKPVYVFKNLFTAVRIRPIAHLFIPTMFLPLFSPSTFLLVLPPLFQNLLSNYYWQKNLLAQYSFPVIAFIFIASIYGAYNLIYHKSFLKKISRDKKKFAISIYLLITGFLVNHYFSPSPLAKKPNFYRVQKYDHFGHFQITEHARIGHKFLKLIPQDASVCAQDKFIPHLTHREDIYEFRGLDKEPFLSKSVDYLFFDTSSKTFNLEQDVYYKQIASFLMEKKYGVVASEDGYILLKKGYTPEKNIEAFKNLFIILEGEHQRGLVGRNVEDLKAHSQATRCATVEEDKKGHLVFGRCKIYPPGKYRIDYRLKTNNSKVVVSVACIDVSAEHGRTILAEKEIKGKDFAKSNKYQFFSLYFNQLENKKLEFRVFFTAKADLWVDYIRIVCLQPFK